MQTCNIHTHKHILPVLVLLGAEVAVDVRPRHVVVQRGIVEVPALGASEDKKQKQRGTSPHQP